MLAFLGGTGPEGKGLALRLAMAGESVIIGSRDAGRAQEAAEELLALAPNASISGAVNADAAAQCEVVFLTMPYSGMSPTIEGVGDTLAGKTLVTVIAPMRFERGVGAIAEDVAAGSAAQEAQAAATDARVVAAFQNVSAEELLKPGVTLDEDVVICSDDADAKTTVMDLTRKIPNLRPVDAGALYNARYVEQITPLLVNINRIHRAHSGVRITGV
ncbi:F420-dependent NADP reductase [Geodia barretti]|uniref:F420-dependent NADP reductase n=1 Tax=Geodia barretti TaxID=519541 RepID=A0AA35W2D4_GEOBA|nr:F420-dependent NADP reductase [Geodia barretti]